MPVTEKLIQFIWQMQLLNKQNLQTVCGQPLQILQSGTLNTNQGPDFLQAKIQIGTTMWIGNVELHVHSSDWKKHKHSSDENYKNIILHVVWINDDTSDQSFPVLEIQNYVPKVLLDQYERLMHNPAHIACQGLLHTVPDIVWHTWQDRMLVERLEQKTQSISDDIQTTTAHWETIFWWKLARNFGLPVNGEVFEAMAKSISVNILAKHKSQIHQLEALLLGQAGLLQSRFTGHYPIMLQKEYLFLKQKYKLPTVYHSVHFLRMRPSGFPTIRLAQLAMVVHQSIHLFSKIKAADSLNSIKELFSATANDYWHTHYRFEEESDHLPKAIGNDMVQNIIINTVVPVLFAYARHNNDDFLQQKTISWLAALPRENNKVTRLWQDAGFSAGNAGESQALLHLYSNYCQYKKCLHCSAGASLLKPA